MDSETVIHYTDEEAFPIIEACLFAAGHPVTYSKLGSVLNITADECRDLVEKFCIIHNGSYNRGVILVLFPDSCQLCTKENYMGQIKEVLGIKRGGNLSQSLLEVLAIVAYNQPATRAFVDTVRGVDSSYAMSSLAEKNLIEVCGRLDAPGKPALYRTTTDFLRVFGISSISDLPSVQIKNIGGESIEISPSIPQIDEAVSETEQ